HHGGIDQRIPEKQFSTRVVHADRHPVIFPCGFSVPVDHFGMSPADAKIRMRAELFVLPFDPAWQGNVVTVEDRDEFTPGLPDPSVPGKYDTLVLFIVQEPDAPVAVTLDDATAVIRRAVVDDQ